VLGAVYLPTQRSGFALNAQIVFAFRSYGCLALCFSHRSFPLDFLQVHVPGCRSSRPWSRLLLLLPLLLLPRLLLLLHLVLKCGPLVVHTGTIYAHFLV
jgi:hypothetical protein